MVIGVLIAVPLLVLPFCPEDAQYAPSFIAPSALLFALGIVTALPVWKARTKATAEWQAPLLRGSAPVMFAWTVSILAGAIPFVLSGQLNVLHALFESVSGWSTTGLTIMDVTNVPNIFLFHRAFMQYSGGLGFIIIIGIIVHGRQMATLYNAEGHPDGLMPNLKRTSRTIFFIYNSCLALGSILYVLFGMPPFDAICHAMSAISTAGFTTRAGSIGAFDSLPIELVTIALMLIGASNFAVLLLLVKRRFKRVLKTAEVRTMLVLLAIFVPLVALSLAAQSGLSVGQAIRHAAFSVVAMLSTTGYSAMDYAALPAFALGLLLPLMIIGGSTGSTGGGIKLLRAYILFRVTRDNFKKRLSPAHTVTVARYTRPQGDAPLDNELILDTVEFIAAFFGILVVGTLLLTLTAGCSLFDAMFAFMSAFVTVGLPNAITGPHSGAGTLIVEMVGMLLGRLEIFIVFIGAYSGIRALGGRLFKILKKTGGKT
jgi:trk system potassium uptake protein TrkH